MENIMIVSTSHIARQSVEDVKKAFEEEKPGVVALELDQRRLHALFTNDTSRSPALIREIGVTGYLFVLIGGFLQKKMGNIVGTTPGIEMKTAVRLAKKNGAKIFLVDQALEITLRKLSRQVSFREKMRVVFDLFFGWFRKDEKLKIDLDKVPGEELVSLLKEKMKESYPSIYKVLVSDRNKIMAKNIKFIRKEHPDDKILIVVGAGHCDLTELLK